MIQRFIWQGERAKINQWKETMVISTTRERPHLQFFMPINPWALYHSYNSHCKVWWTSITEKLDKTVIWLWISEWNRADRNRVVLIRSSQYGFVRQYYQLLMFSMAHELATWNSGQNRKMIGVKRHQGHTLADWWGECVTFLRSKHTPNL